MRVAFVYSGQIRNIEETHKQHREFIEKYDADVFGSFWSVTDNDLNFNNLENFKKLFNAVHCEEEDLESWNQCAWNQIKRELESPEDLFSVGKKAIESGNIYYMWYKIWRSNFICNQFKKNYDVVVRLRTDLEFPLGLDLEINNHLNIPSGLVEISNWKNCFGPHDILAWGSSEVMNIYSSVFIYLQQYLSQNQYIYPPENILRHHLSNYEISIRLYGTFVSLFNRTGTVGNRNQDLFINSQDWKMSPNPDKTFYKPSSRSSNFTI